MRRRKYAVIDVNTLPDFLIFAPILARWMGAALVLDMHEITPEFYRSKYGIAESSFVIHLLKFLERISFNFADHVITINEPVEDLLAGRGLARSKTIVMMNSADEARFVRPATTSAAEAVATPAATFAMIYHGTLTRIYGLDIAIEAFATVHEQMPGAEMWILGSGPEREALGRLAQERGLEGKVKLVGQVPGSAIPTWLNNATVGILPIRRDALLDFAFPNKLPEYIVMGRAVIVSRLKAIRHYFSEDSLAYFEPNSPADLATQMVRMYDDAGLRARLAAKASEEYAPIRWDLMKGRYLRLMEQIVDPARQTASAVARTKPVGH
jgi:glycosyltransferase involved in cell wall biosynthesis